MEATKGHGGKLEVARTEERDGGTRQRNETEGREESGEVTSRHDRMPGEGDDGQVCTGKLERKKMTNHAFQ